VHNIAAATMVTMVAEAHVMVVPAQIDDWYVEHPPQCPVSRYSARELERWEEGSPCDYWTLEDGCEDRITGWSLAPGRYEVDFDCDVEYHGVDDFTYAWWLTTRPIGDDVAVAATVTPTPVVTAPVAVETTEPFEPVPRRLHHGGHHLRSIGELKTAVLLDLLGVRWAYEWKQFHLADGTLYTPDFLVPGGEYGPVLEVKPRELVREIASALGMPRVGTGKLGAIEHYDVERAPVTVATLPAPIRKPALLAQLIERDVWLVGGHPRSNQPYIAFHPDSTASMSRQCPLYARHELLDETERIVRERRSWADDHGTGG
jgi:hypothetical protein